jgi:hypothetical protein
MCRDALHAGRSGDQIPLGARFSASVQSRPEAHPASCKWVPGSFHGSKAARAWCWPPTPSNAEVKGRVELYLYSPSWPSWPGLWWTLSYFYLKENTVHNWKVLPIPGAARCTSWVCGRSITGIAVLNPAGGMHVCHVWVLCAVRYRFLRRADHSSRGVLVSVVCRHVIVKPRQLGGPYPAGSVMSWKVSSLEWGESSDTFYFKFIILLTVHHSDVIT